MRLTNSDPVTGQAAWYDVMVRLEKCAPAEAAEYLRSTPWHLCCT